MVKSFITGVRRLNWQPYAWLVYSMPYLYGSFDHRLSLGETGAMLGGFVVFLVAFVEMLLRLNQVVHAPLYALFLVGPTAVLIEIWLESRQAVQAVETA